MISEPRTVLFVLTIVVVVSLVLEKRVALCRSFGAAFVCLITGMVLSNIGLLPGTSPTYDFLMGPGVSIGIALILFNVNVKSVLEAGPRMLAAFGLGAVGTAVGATVGALLLSGLIGPETWKLAGQFTGTYTGGGVNFAALGRALDTSPDLFSAAIAADVMLTAIWMATCLAVPVMLGRKRAEVAAIPASDTPTDSSQPPTLERALSSTGRPMVIADAAALVALAIGTVWAAGQLAELLPFLPEVLWLTTLVLIVSQIPAVKAIAGGALFGNYLILLFLAGNGAQSVVANIVAVGPAVFYFALITVAVHGATIFGLGMLFRIDLPTLAVASQANVGGAASAMAIAGARGYADRLLPGVAVGLLGYAIGNYTGFAVARLVSGLLGVG
jgi:uncharacterized membrane protein